MNSRRAEAVPKSQRRPPDPFVRQPGDANEDREFDADDVILALSRAKYGTGEPATWREGDWDGAPNPQFTDGPPPGNGLFDSSDIVAALGAGLFETGPYAAVTDRASEHNITVPEPSSLVMALIALLAVAASGRCRRPAHG